MNTDEYHKVLLSIAEQNKDRIKFDKDIDMHTYCISCTKLYQQAIVFGDGVYKDNPALDKHIQYLYLLQFIHIYMAMSKLPEYKMHPRRAARPLGFVQPFAALAFPLSACPCPL